MEEYLSALYGGCGSGGAWHHVWHTKTGEALLSYHVGLACGPYAQAFSPDGKLFIDLGDRVDTVYIGLNGIDAENGLTPHYVDEAAIVRGMIHQANRKIVVADHFQNWRHGPGPYL